MKKITDNYDKEQARLQKLVTYKAKEEADKENLNPVVPPPAPIQEPAPVVDENSNIVNNVTTVPNTVVPEPAPVYDENTPYVQPQAEPTAQTVAPVVQPEAQQPSEADALLQRLYSIKEPEPVIDQAKIDRLQRMGKINGIAQSANVLGDMLALGLGANVRKRQPDRIAPMIYQQYESLMDRNKAEKDAWNLRGTQRDRENLIHGISEVHRKEAEKLADARLKAQTELQKQKAEQDWSKFAAGLKQKDRDLLERNRHNLEMEKSARIRANRTGAAKAGKATAEEKPFDAIEVKDEKGNNIKLSQGDWSNLYSDAMKDKEFLNGDIKAMLSAFKALPDGGLKQIARAYHYYKAAKNAMPVGDATNNAPSAKPAAKKDWSKFKD